MTYIFLTALAIAVVVGLLRSLSGDPRPARRDSMFDQDFDDGPEVAGAEVVKIPGIPQVIPGMQDLLRDE